MNAYPTKQSLFRAYNAARKAAQTGAFPLSRLNAALGLALSARTAWWNDGTLDVPSRSKPGESYTVTWEHCGCQGKSYRPGQHCAHNIAFALLKRAWDFAREEGAG